MNKQVTKSFIGWLIALKDKRTMKGFTGASDEQIELDLLTLRYTIRQVIDKNNSTHSKVNGIRQRLKRTGKML